MYTTFLQMKCWFSIFRWNSKRQRQFQDLPLSEWWMRPLTKFVNRLMQPSVQRKQIASNWNNSLCCTTIDVITEFMTFITIIYLFVLWFQFAKSTAYRNKKETANITEWKEKENKRLTSAVQNDLICLKSFKFYFWMYDHCMSYEIHPAHSSDYYYYYIFNY